MIELVPLFGYLSSVYMRFRVSGSNYVPLLSALAFVSTVRTEFLYN